MYVLICKALINYDEFFLVNNVLKQYNEMKKEVKNCENAVSYDIQIWLIWSEKHIKEMVQKQYWMVIKEYEWMKSI